MEQNPIRIAEILLGLKDVNLLGIEDLIEDGVDTSLSPPPLSDEPKLTVRISTL
ncbi:MAG: hypothetical protein HKL82_10945 [Acidimicrobiaceae bacterium]|nr:hypothetical protein [Acidimicrobiaceae bacterium]